MTKSNQRYIYSALCERKCREHYCEIQYISAPNLSVDGAAPYTTSICSILKRQNDKETTKAFLLNVMSNEMRRGAVLSFFYCFNQCCVSSIGDPVLFSPLHLGSWISDFRSGSNPHFWELSNIFSLKNTLNS
jgi:hypothetical protein